MTATFQIAIPKKQTAPTTMKALVFHGPGQIRVEQVSIPRPGPGEAVIRVTLTTICGTDLHILKGEYPVKPGLIIGHEPVGVIHELGVGVTDYAVGPGVSKSLPELRQAIADALTILQANGAHKALMEKNGVDAQLERPVTAHTE